MSEALLQQLIGASKQVPSLYHRLVLLVGPAGAGKTAALRRFAAEHGARLVNINLELSRALLDVPRAQRRVTVPRLLGEIIEAHPGDTVLLDNIEILFDPELQLDPLRALQQLSRNRTVVASWNGRAEAGRLLYAEPSHPEFRDYSAHDLVLVITSRPPAGGTP